MFRPVKKTYARALSLPWRRATKAERTNCASVPTAGRWKTFSTCKAGVPRKPPSSTWSPRRYTDQGRTQTYLPSVYYLLATPTTAFALLDQNVNESPLTLQNVVLRGLHLKSQEWSFHAGYTASASFADLLIPTEKEFASGLSWRGILKGPVSASPGFFFLHSIDLSTGRERSTVFGSVLFNVRLWSGWHLQAEVARNREFATPASCEGRATPARRASA